MSDSQSLSNGFSFDYHTWQGNLTGHSPDGHGPCLSPKFGWVFLGLGLGLESVRENGASIHSHAVGVRMNGGADRKRGYINVRCTCIPTGAQDAAWRSPQFENLIQYALYIVV